MAKASAPINTDFEVVDDLLEGLDVPAAQIARINARLARLLADDDVLREIRLECGIAQKAVAADLGVTASAIAQLEARSLDAVQLGTVRRYFEALGYELTVSLTPLQAATRSGRQSQAALGHTNSQVRGERASDARV